MKKYVAIIMVFLILFVTGCSANQKNDSNLDGNPADKFQAESSEYSINPDNVEYDKDSGELFINNEIVVSASSGVGYNEINNLVKQYDAKIISSIESINEYQIRFDKKHSYNELQDIIQKISKSELIDSSENNIILPLSLNTCIEDGECADEWDDDLPEDASWGFDYVECSDAWKYRNKFKKVNVGVYDNQFFENHSDLTYSFLYENSFSLDSKMQHPEHGTHVSGIIAAKFDKKGICGVSPNASLFCVSSNGLKNNLTLLEAIEKEVEAYFTWDFGKSECIHTSYGIKKGFDILINQKKCKVINISMGIEDKTKNDKLAKCYKDIFSKFLKKQLKNNDFIICQSSGNLGEKGIDTKYSGIFCGIEEPELKSHILIVGALKKAEDGKVDVSKYTQKGKTVDIVAPGSNIYGTITNDGKTGDYGFRSGTSMASPMVAGIAAMVWGANPKLTGAQVKDILCQSIKTKISGYPVVNAKLAVEKAIKSSKNILDEYQEEETNRKTKSNSWQEAAIEFIYNLPNYVTKPKDTRIGVELIDLNGDKVPEIVTCDYRGSIGVPQLSGVYYFDSGKYRNGSIPQEYSTVFPLIPKMQNNKVVFLSEIMSDKELDDRDSYPRFASFWNRGPNRYIYKLKYEAHVLSEELIYDFSEYMSAIQGEESEEYKNMKWEEYKDKISAVNSEYITAEGYKYTVVSLPSLINMDNRLTLYHEGVSIDDGKNYVNAYLNGENSYKLPSR